VSRRPPRRLSAIAALAFILSAPGLAVLLALVADRRLAATPALVAGAVVLGFSALFAIRFDLAQAALHETVESLAAGAVAAAEEAGRRASPLFGEAWLAILRMGRLFGARLEAAQSGLAAAEAVLSALPAPLILVDERRRIVRANAAAAPFVGRISEPRDLASALRNPALLAAVEAVLRGAGPQVVEFTALLPVERRLRVRIARTDRPTLDAAVAVLALHDITELKRAEQMRVDFIANASHELRTPLTALIGFIETLQGPAREDVEARERFLAIMQREAERMARLVADLLSLSRIELNEHLAPEGRVAIGTVLREAADALALRAEERGMSIEVMLPPRLPEIHGEADELAQVFYNLLDNAIKYGRAGTKIAVAAAPTLKRPREGDGAPAPHLAVAVRNEGEEIPPEHVPRLTERFYRVDTARSRELGGTGLGLAIVKHILNRHRGFLEIESEAGKGSVFTVFVPQAEAAQTADVA
jgi:two-component system phosphate regulon sensor histidine kinase PhoR